MMNTNFKAEAKLTLPEKVDSNIGDSFKLLSEGLTSIMKLPEKIIDTVVTSGATLFKPLVAYLNGKAAVTEAHSFVEAQNIRKELSQCQLAINVAKNLAIKQQSNQYTPTEIIDTDTLFAIQNAASETTDKDFLEFWSHLYTEEACKPNTVSKKTVYACKMLDKNIVQVLENKIFPYCTQGFFLATQETSVEDISKAVDYGFLVQQDRYSAPNNPRGNVNIVFGEYTFCCRPGFIFQPQSPVFCLTIVGNEVRKLLMKEVDYKYLKSWIQMFSEAAKHWNLNDRFVGYRAQLIPGKYVDTNFVVARENQIVYPESWKGKTIEEYKKVCMETLDIKAI